MADLTSNQVCNICCIHYSAGLRCCALGTTVEGGRLFAKQGRNAWIVAPVSSEVSRTWALRDDAVTVAQAAAACGDWFVPSRDDLNFALSCRSFWDSFSNSTYWTSVEVNTTRACGICFVGSAPPSSELKTTTFCVRAFRRVFY